MNRQPFLVLIAVVAVAVVVAVLLSRIDPVPEPVAPNDLVVEASSTPTPPPQPPEEPDFSTSKRLQKADVLPLYEAMRERISSYQTAQTRVRFDLSAKVHGKPTETEVRFDGDRPDRVARRVYAGTPRDTIDPDAIWEVIPRFAESLVEGRMRRIEYPSLGVYDVNMDSTDEVLQDYFQSLRDHREKLLEDPLVDLLHKIPREDRLKENIEAEEIKTSQGPEIQVTYRVNAAIGGVLKSSALATYFPALPNLLKEVVYVRDVFRKESGALDRVEFLTLEEEPFVVQRYLEVVWDEPIPADRFDLELPEHAHTYDMNRMLGHKARLNLTSEKVREMLESGEMDWAALKQKANDY